MLINMSPCGSTLEEQLSFTMNKLAKAAVSEISQLFAEGSATLRLQMTRSLKENEALRTRMRVTRRELFSLRLQTRSNASRAALARANVCKTRTTSLGNGELSSPALIGGKQECPSVQGALDVTFVVIGKSTYWAISHD